IDIRCPLVIAKIALSQSDGAVDLAESPHQEVCSGVTARQGIGIAGETSIGGKPASGEFVTELQVLVVAPFSTEPERVFALDPGEVIGHLVDFVVDGEWAVRTVAKPTEVLGVAQRDVRDAPGVWIGDLDGGPEFRIHVFYASQLLAD